MLLNYPFSIEELLKTNEMQKYQQIVLFGRISNDTFFWRVCAHLYRGVTAVYAINLLPREKWEAFIVVMDTYEQMKCVIIM